MKEEAKESLTWEEIRAQLPPNCCFEYPEDARISQQELDNILRLMNEFADQYGAKA